MLRYDRGVSVDETKSMTVQSLVTFFSFIAFESIPLLPYILLPDALGSLFVYALLSALASLVLLGVLNWRVSGSGVVRSVFEILITGVLSGGVTYLVGTFFDSPNHFSKRCRGAQVDAPVRSLYGPFVP